jgi:hypothetical protein
MGAGNPEIKSFDEHLFSPETYYIHMLDAVEDIDEDENVIDGVDIVVLEEELIETIQMVNENFEAIEDRDSNMFAELASGFREYGILIGEGEYSYLVTTTDCDDRFVFGFIPNFKYDDILDDICTQHESEINEKMENLAEIEYSMLLHKFFQEYIPIVKKLGEVYDDIMSVRTGPWTSGKVWRGI